MKGSAELLLLAFLAQDPRAALERLDDPDPRVRMEAHESILKLGEPALDLLRDRRRWAQGEELRFRLDVLIAKLDPAIPKSRAEDLLGAYWARGAAGRAETIRLLGAAGASAALLEIGKGESDPALRAKAVWALRGLRGEEHEAFFRGLLKEEDRGLRAEALVALAELGKCGADPLREAARDPDPRMHRAVTRSLAALPEREIEACAIDFLRSTSAVLRLAAVDVVRRRRMASRAEDLVVLIRDPDRLVRRRALETLLEMDADESAAALGRLSTCNNRADRRLLVASLERTASVKPIPILLDRLRRLEPEKRKPTPRDLNPEREDAVYVLGRLSSLLGAPQARPAPLPPAAVRLRAEPEDPAEGFRRAFDGAWGKDAVWTHKRGTVLFLDLGEPRPVHSVVALKNGGFPLLFASADGESYEWCANLGASAFEEPVLVDARARYFKIDPARGIRSFPDEGAVREIILYTVKGEGVLAAWEAWWKGLEPRLSDYAAAREILAEVRRTMGEDPAAAARRATELVEKFPRLYAAYQARAEARLRAADAEGAAADARQALALAPEAVGLHVLEGEACLLGRRWDPALEAAGRTLAEAPGDPRAHFLAARARAGKGEKAAALEDLVQAVFCGFEDRRALESDPSLGPLRTEKPYDRRFAEILELLR